MLPSRAVIAAETALLPDRCQQRLDALRKECPGIPALVDEGVVLDPVALTEEQVASELHSVLSIHPGLEIVWSDADSELLVRFGKSRVALLPGGVLLVGVPVETVETGPAELTVPLALGSDDRLAGMNAVTERKVSGPEILTSRWSDAVIAAVWAVLQDVASARAAQAGHDRFNFPLVPAALIVEPPTLQIVPRALYDFEREALL